VGPLGAALSNILFSCEGAEVLMIDPGMYDMFFYDLSALRKHVFSWLFSQKIEFSQPSKLHAKYRVNQSHIKQALEFNWG
jgi:capsular polysaccharide biosynthesis protein